MRIGFLINTCEPFYRGGYERRAWSFARELARRGHDVRIYTSCPRDEVIDGVRFVRLAPPRPYFNSRGVRNGWADGLFALSVLKLLGKRGPDELDIIDVCATPFLHLPLAALVGKLRGIPMILTCHEALLSSLPAYAAERGHKSPVIRGMLVKLLETTYRFGMRIFPRRLAVSKRTAAALEQEGYPATATVEFGLEPEAFRPKPPEAWPENTPTRFISCGRLTPIKEVASGVMALVALKNKSLGFHFDIVGEGSERRSLDALVRKAEMENQVTFHGEVSEEAKRALLAQNEVFLLSSRREGFSIATLEAMAQGCAAIVGNDPENPNGALDFVRDGIEGLVAEDLSAAVEKMASDPVRRLEMRRAAWKTAQTYCVETQAERLLAAYQA